MVRVLSRQLDVPIVDLRSKRIAPEVLSAISDPGGGEAALHPAVQEDRRRARRALPGHGGSLRSLGAGRPGVSHRDRHPAGSGGAESADRGHRASLPRAGVGRRRWLPSPELERDSRARRHRAHHLSRRSAPGGRARRAVRGDPWRAAPSLPADVPRGGGALLRIRSAERGQPLSSPIPEPPTEEPRVRRANPDPGPSRTPSRRRRGRAYWVRSSSRTRVLPSCRSGRRLGCGIVRPSDPATFLPGPSCVP